MSNKNIHYFCIACITIDSIINFKEKNRPLVYLEECKYRIKKTQMPKFIKKLLKSDSDLGSDLDSDLDLDLDDRKLMAKFKKSDIDFDYDSDSNSEKIKLQ